MNEMAEDELRAIVADGERVVATYEQRTKEIRELEKAEEARRKEAEAMIRQAWASNQRLHSKISAAADAKRELVSRALPRELVSQRDRALSQVNRAKVEVDTAQANVRRQEEVIARKSAETVIGVLRDATGKPLREPSGDPLVADRPKRGPVRNPQRFRNDEQREAFERVLTQLQEVEAIALGRLQEATRVYDVAQAAIDEALRRAGL